jgi:tetratricopeptide (TPR) repeat protein
VDNPRAPNDLVEAVLEGRSVDWASEESSADTPRREAIRHLKALAGIAELHRGLMGDSPARTGQRVPEGQLERWGRLEILERIGRGSYGEVYRAWDPKLDREVAVKLLHAGKRQPASIGSTDSAAATSSVGEPVGATVLQEARLLARVRHPNVVTVYDADEIEGRVGLWMEFIHGRNLEQILVERKKFGEREVTSIGIELCRALSAVHDAGLLHRDIKTQNLMQAGDGRLILMDFGTGRELEKTPAPSVDTAGTPLYLAPEIFTGGQASIRADIYSTGVLLFHLLTGAYPFRGATIEEVGEAHASGQRLGLEARAPGVSRPLAAVIGRALEPDPSKRFASAREMLAALGYVQRETEELTARRHSAHAFRRAALIAAGFALAIVLVAGVAWLSRGDSARAGATLRALPFQARDSVLVANFENRSGEKLFDGTLDYDLGLELSNSRHINVVSPERVGDSLRLMRKPVDSPLSAALAREICLRDGGIRAFLTGRVEKVGSGYLLSVELVDPKEGTTLAGFREKSEGTDGSLAAMQRISDRVRAALGEARGTGTSEDERLVKVTTTNLRALQLYSQADLLMHRGDGSQAAAEELLRQAVAEDPTFASAWIHLAWTVFNQARPLAEFQPYAETALRLADTVTDRERYFIQGSYYHMVGEREKAIAAYEALLAMYPDHPWAPNNLCHLYDFRHDPRELEKGVQVEARFADARPKDFLANWNAAFNFVAMKPEPARAEPYLRRASELVTPELRDKFPFQVNWMDLLPFTQSWVNGDLGAAAKEIDRVAATIDPLGGRSRDVLAVQAALGYLTLGRIETAARTSDKIVDPVVRNDMLAQIAFIKADAPALRHNLQVEGDRESPASDVLREWTGIFETTLILQVREGLMGDAERYLKQPHWKYADYDWLRGEVALANGNLAAGIRDLEEACKLGGDSLSRESLAAALVKKGDVPRAIQALEREPDRSRTVIGGSTGAYWLRNRLQLARLYRRAGRVEDARAVEAGLSKLLAFADADHPILVELRKLQGA